MNCQDDGNRGNVLRSRIARLQTCLSSGCSFAVLAATSHNNFAVRKQIRKLQDDMKLVARRLSSVKKTAKEQDSDADDWYVTGNLTLFSRATALGNGSANAPTGEISKNFNLARGLH